MSPHSARTTVMGTATLSTPVGAFTILVGDAGLAAAGFTADPEDLRLLLPVAQREATLRPIEDAGGLGAALAAYFAGDLAAIDGVRVASSGTAYQQRAWAALRSLPPGRPVTYAELAARTGSPAAARAAGSACGRNPTAVVVPCHRVVRADGTVGGFLWGTEVKRWLLAHERRHAALTPASPPPRPPVPGRRPPAGRRS